MIIETDNGSTLSTHRAPFKSEVNPTASGIRTTKLQLAFDALEFANGNVSEAKRIVAKHGDRISAHTWYKAINTRLAHLSRRTL
jgi:hypothetical protein